MNRYFIWMSLIVVALFLNSCEEDAQPKVIETGTLTDIEGNEYKTVKIGQKWWMAENLRVKSYRDGTPVQQIQNANDWEGTSPAYCIIPNNTTTGLLYNWHAANNSSNIAPEGWRVPTDEDWKELEQAVGMSLSEADATGWRGTNEGEKLRIEGTQGWIEFEGVWPTNEYGFSASAGGCRLFNGTWSEPGLFHVGFWWTSSAADSDEAWFRYLDYKNPDVFRGQEKKSYGFSIRCIKE